MRRISTTVLALGACLLVANNASAQLEEIIVTATKRGSVDVQDVPYNIQAIGGDVLDAIGAQEFYDVARKSGVQSTDEGPGQKRFIVRGLNLAGTSTVGLYYDDIPATGFGANANGGGQPDFRVLDLERVEILRGPQGTLYGSGSVGGTIRYVTNKPNLQEVSGNIGVDYGNISQGGGNALAVDGVLNLPLAEDVFGVRLVGFYTERDGIVQHPFSGTDGTDFHDTTGGRFMARWQPADAWTIDASFWTQDTDVGDRLEYNPLCDPFVNACWNGDFDSLVPPTESPITSSSNNHVSTQGVTTPHFEEMDISALRIEYGGERFTFSSSTSFFIRDVESSFESTDLAANFFGSPSGVMPVLTAQDTEQFSQEFLLTSNFDGPINFVAGAFYLDRDDLFHQVAGVMEPSPRTTDGITLLETGSPPQDYLDFVSSQCLPPDFTFCLDQVIGDGIIFDSTIDRGFTHQALFGEVNWQVTDNFAVDLGLRWFEMESDLTETKIRNPDFPCIIFAACDSGSIAQGDYDDVIAKITGSYSFNDDILGYVTYSEGFREGGVNPVRTSGDVPLQFEPDEATSWEVGLKTQLADNQLILNTSYYTMEVRNLQIGVPDRTQLFGAILNMSAGVGDLTRDEGVDIDGVEVEAIWAPSALEGFTAQVGVQYTDTAITATPPSVDTDTGDVVPGNPVTAGSPGDPLAGVAEWTWSATLNHNFQAFGQDAFVNLNWSSISDSNSDNSPLDPVNVKLGDYQLLGLRLGISGQAWGGWSATLYARNLLDEDGLISRGDRSNFCDPSDAPACRYNGLTDLTTYPRTVGIAIRKDF